MARRRALALRGVRRTIVAIAAFFAIAAPARADFSITPTTTTQAGALNYFEQTRTPRETWR